MRMLRACAVTGALALLASGPAWGSDHLMRVNEVGLSAAGNPGAQYVELRDSDAEPFPFGPYRVVVFSPAGARLGAQTLGGGLGTLPHLVSTTAADQAFGTTADTRLTVALPRPAGQVCFTRGLTEARIHCLAYGAVATRLSSEGGSQAGPSPPDCRSLERTAAGSYSLDSPTPNASNAGRTTTGACASAPGADTTPPRQRLALRRRRDVDNIVLRVRLGEPADLTVSGFARIAGKSRKLRFRTVRKQVQAGVLTRVVLKLRRSRRVAVKEAIADGKTVRARVKVEAEDARGNESETQRRITLTN